MILSFRGGIGSGKTTAAQFLVKEFDFTRVSFAEPLKIEVFDYLWRGITPPDDVWSQFCQFERRDVCPLYPDLDFGATDLYYVEPQEKVAWVNARKGSLGRLLQWWGTEYRRKQFGENYWLDQFHVSVDAALRTSPGVAVDDARFDNELDAIVARGGLHIYIDNPKAEGLARVRSGSESRDPAHESERLNDPHDPRNWLRIVNDSDLWYFHEVLRTVESLAWREFLARRSQ